MSTILFDIETDGLYREVSKIHCIALKRLGEEDTARVFSDHDTGGEAGTIEAALRELINADELVGHKIINYDLSVLEKLYGFQYEGRLFDTLIASKILFPMLKTSDIVRWKRGAFPGKLIGSHSLEAWGNRLGNRKGTYCHTTDWQRYCAEMRDYCRQDVEVNHALYNMCMRQEISQDAFDLEMEVAKIITKQEHDGWPFDLEAARKLHLEWLEKRDAMDAEIAEMIPPFHDVRTFTPKATNSLYGYVRGVPFTQEKETKFNPNSRQHILRFFREKYHWEPVEFTEKNTPKVDEEVLSQLKYPEAPLLAKRFELQKHIAMLAEGSQGWLKQYNPETGRIHGSIDTVGTRTRRGAHRNPNLGQVPAHTEYGKACRSLFYAPDGFVEIGVDASALELRCLAHYMAHYDGGEYINVVLNGSKEDGSDMHSRNAKALELSRDDAKTWFYAFIYGAGDLKLGSIGSPVTLSKGKLEELGKKRRNAFLDSLPALRKLTDRAKELTKERGYLYSLDRQRLVSPSVHAALNTLLQSAGAILVKRVMVIADHKLREAGLHLQQLGWIHDEMQYLAGPEEVETAVPLLLQSFVEAGEYYHFRCPIEGEAKVGKNWQECH